MQAVAGIFGSRVEAERAAAELHALGVPGDRIALLTPGSDARRVPTDEGESPGMGAALGGLVGGVTGASLGIPVGAMLTLLVPGVGPVIASSLVGAALLGAGGAAVGSALEESLTRGLPRDELFLYEDALRREHSVVVALAEDDATAGSARAALGAAGAESIDAARERWWLGLRSAEQERYEHGPHAFARDEALFRRGFEAALDGAARGRGWDESVARLRARHGGDADAPAFRHGWERGQRYHEELGRGQDLRRSA
jgi:hypothetical protein